MVCSAMRACGKRAHEKGACSRVGGGVRMCVCVRGKARQRWQRKMHGHAAGKRNMGDVACAAAGSSSRQQQAGSVQEGKAGKKRQWGGGRKAFFSPSPVTGGGGGVEKGERLEGRKKEKRRARHATNHPFHGNPAVGDTPKARTHLIVVRHWVLPHRLKYSNV